MKIVTVADNGENPGFGQLRRSLRHFRHDYELILAQFIFGGQMPVIAHWCARQKPETVFLYTDAFDTFCFGDGKEVLEKFNAFGAKMVVSAEKNCFPNPLLAKFYPETTSEYKYVNGGGFMTTAGYFSELYDRKDHEGNDQTWLTNRFLRKRGEIALDYGCEIFQTLVLTNESEFGVDGARLVNKAFGSRPCFVHGNGRAPMDFVYKILDGECI
jgi:hypothetical protein